MLGRKHVYTFSIPFAEMYTHRPHVAVRVCVCNLIIFQTCVDMRMYAYTLITHEEGVYFTSFEDIHLDVFHRLQRLGAIEATEDDFGEMSFRFSGRWSGESQIYI